MIKNTDLKKILLDASKIIESYFYSDIGTQYKEDSSPVTIADFETNEYLKKELNSLLPEAGWLSEEDKDNTKRLTKEYVWVVDPLDGTKEFVDRIPHIVISISLVKDNQPILGAIMNPISKEYGIGSIWDNIEFGLLESVNNSVIDISKASILVSRTEKEANKLDKYFNLFPNMKVVGSVAYKLLRVASGKDDLYFSVYSKSEWDICAGVFLLRASGKDYQRLDQKELLFNQKDPKISSGSIAGYSYLIDSFLDIVK